MKVLRVIARLNMGGPAHHVSLLSGRLDPQRYDTLLVHGRVGAGEDSLEAVADREGATRRYVEALRPELHPVHDLRALFELIRIVREFRPDIVHTHTAKAGMVGRAAAVLARPRHRPVIIHTYHGHVLEGYFGRAKNAFYRGLERTLARFSDRLIGVSEATVDDLVRLGVAPREKFEVIRIGLDLSEFETLDPQPGGPLRAELAPNGEVVFGWVGRMAPIKRVDVLIRALAHARAAGADVRLALVGDGELRGELEALAYELDVFDAISWLGYRSDVAVVIAACDAVALSSDNEGTPVSLIEAGAAGRPVVSTDVGGVREVVADGVGRLVAVGDHAALGEAVAALAVREPGYRRNLGQGGREHATERHGVARLVAEMEALYRRQTDP